MTNTKSFDELLISSVVTDVEFKHHFVAFMEWWIVDNADAFNMINCKYDAVHLHHNWWDSGFAIEFRMHPATVTEMYWVKSRVSIYISKRNGKHSFRIVNMKRAKRNRKPKFVTFGTDQDIKNEYSRWKLSTI